MTIEDAVALVTFREYACFAGLSRHIGKIDRVGICCIGFESIGIIRK